MTPSALVWSTVVGGRRRVRLGLGRVGGWSVLERLLGAGDQANKLVQGDVETRRRDGFGQDEGRWRGAIGRGVVADPGRGGDAGGGPGGQRRRVAVAERTPGRERRVGARAVSGAGNMEGADGMAAAEGRRLAEGTAAEGTGEEGVYGGRRGHGGSWRAGRLAAGFTGRGCRWPAGLVRSVEPGIAPGLQLVLLALAGGHGEEEGGMGLSGSGSRVWTRSSSICCNGPRAAIQSPSRHHPSPLVRRPMLAPRPHPAPSSLPPPSRLLLPCVRPAPPRPPSQDSSRETALQWLGLPLNFDVVQVHLQIDGYQMYAVEKWSVPCLASCPLCLTPSQDCRAQSPHHCSCRLHRRSIPQSLFFPPAIPLP